MDAARRHLEALHPEEELSPRHQRLGSNASANLCSTHWKTPEWPFQHPVVSIASTATATHTAMPMMRRLRPGIVGRSSVNAAILPHWKLPGRCIGNIIALG